MRTSPFQKHREACGYFSHLSLKKTSDQVSTAAYKHARRGQRKKWRRFEEETSGGDDGTVVVHRSVFMSLQPVDLTSAGEVRVEVGKSRIGETYEQPPHFHPSGVGNPWRSMSHVQSVRFPCEHAWVMACTTPADVTA